MKPSTRQSCWEKTQGLDKAQKSRWVVDFESILFIYIYICIAQSQRDILGTMSSWVFGWSTLGSIILSHIETRWYSETLLFLVLWPDRSESFSSKLTAKQPQKKIGRLVVFPTSHTTTSLVFFLRPQTRTHFWTAIYLHLVGPRLAWRCWLLIWPS